MLERLTNFALGLGENCGFEIVAGAPVETASGPSIAVLAAQRLRALRKRTKQAKSMRSRTLKTLPRAA